MKPLAHGAGTPGAPPNEELNRLPEEAYVEEDFPRSNLNGNATFRDSMKNVPISREEKELYENIHSGV